MLAKFKNTTFRDLKTGDIFAVPSHYPSVRRYAKILTNSGYVALDLSSCSVNEHIFNDVEVIQILGKKITYGVKEKK